MHRATVERLGPRAALRYKRDGIYHDVSWNEYRRLADRAAAGLIELGVKPGDRVAILSENRCEWLIADHAMLSAGAVTVPLHAPLAPKQVEYQVGHSEACGIVVSGQAQADKVWQVLSALPNLRFVIAFDPIKPGRLPDIAWDRLTHTGSRMDEVAAREAAVTPADLATIIYTSGTTGDPKGVMLTHGNLLSNAEATMERMGTDQTDTLLSWLPYSHIYARLVDHYTTTLAGLTVALGGPVETLLDDVARTHPTWITAVPRFYEKVWSGVAGHSPEKRRAELRAMFPRIKHLCSGGAPLPPHICAGFFDAGIPLFEGYGLTESSPVICFNGYHGSRVGSVGKAVTGVEVRIAPDGEILTRGPHVMKGYWKNPQATGETIDRDGWLRTGDVGKLDDEGFLYITDRKKDLIITSGGKNIAPAELERLLLTEPTIDQAVVYGDGRAYVSALIVPNFARLREALGAPPSADGDFIRDDRATKLYAERIGAVMQAVSQPERVKKFLLLSRPFQLAADELTATLKVRRRHVISKYEKQLAELYEEHAVAR